MKILVILLIGIGIFVGIMAILAVIPLVLERILDPLNMRRIRTHCEARGFTVTEIKVYPNHYGVSYQKNGSQFYAKCRVIGRKIKWKDKVPAEL